MPLVFVQTYRQAIAQFGLFTWGFNNTGQLAANSVIQRSSPVQVGALTTWTRVGGNNGTSIGIQSDGTLWTWGNSDAGLLGTGLAFPAQPYTSSPIQVGGTTWAEVADGNPSQHMAAIRTDGTLWLWGSNSVGQLGDNTANNRSSPVQTVSGGANWAQVSLGESHSTAIKTDGTLWTWGLNTYGQLGDNSITTRVSPVQIAGTTWKQVSGGASHLAAVKTDGTLWTWGAGTFGRLGLGDEVNRSSPVQVGGLTDWDEVHCGYNHTLALKTDGTLWAIGGANNAGQLGLGSTAHQSSPIQIGVATDWIHVRGGLLQTAAIRFSGTLWTWGDNFNGGLGLNNTTNQSTPAQVGSLTGWQFVDGGGGTAGHMLALR
jgi:alpha-tubulin suppressor-like RCC1 family protein